MVLSDIPQLKINNIDLKILYVIGEGMCGITLALTTKQNSTTYPLLICKLFKNIQFCKNPNDTVYNELIKYNITPKLISIQHLSDNFKYEYLDFEGYKVKNIFKNIIYYYEIGGFCNLTQYISILQINKYDNIEYLKKYINDILNIIEKINKIGIIHHDLKCDNIMIKNEYTYYLFNLYNLYNKEKNENNKIKLLNEINKYMFTKNKLKISLSDNKLLKNNNLVKSNLISINNKYNISLIDFDFSFNINKEFKTYINKYNLKNKNVKNILQLIYNVWMKCDVINVLFELMEKIKIHSCFNKINNNINDILQFIEFKYKNVINEIINNTVILKELNNNYIAYNIINNILTMTYNINDETFYYMFNYLYTKQYIKDNDYLYYNYEYCKNITNKYLYDNPIKLNEKDKKQIYK